MECSFSTAITGFTLAGCMRNLATHRNIFYFGFVCWFFCFCFYYIYYYLCSAKEYNLNQHTIHFPVHDSLTVQSREKLGMLWSSAYLNAVSCQKIALKRFFLKKKALKKRSVCYTICKVSQPFPRKVSPWQNPNVILKAIVRQLY